MADVQPPPALQLWLNSPLDTPKLQVRGTDGTITLLVGFNAGVASEFRRIIGAPPLE
jgi:hypothetical protein